jgi:hypothetical protein
MCPAYLKWFPTMRIVLLARMILSSQMISELMPLRFVFHMSYLSRIISSHEQLALTGWAIFCDVRLCILPCRARGEPYSVPHFQRQLTSYLNLLLTPPCF